MAAQKSPREIRAQLSACLTSDLDETAKAIWVYLYACKGGGMGTRRLAEVMQIDEKVTENAIEILRERGVLRRKDGTWRADVFELADPMATPEEQRAASGPQGEAAVAMLEHYNEARIGLGIGPLMDTRSALTSFRRLAVWLSEVGASFDAFLAWAMKRTAFMTNFKIPPPNVLAGPWLAGEWANGSDPWSKDVARGGHAGRSYRDVGALRERLIGAGFREASELPKAELRYILETADNVIALPGQIDVPEEHERVIAWLVGKLKAEDASAS